MKRLKFSTAREIRFSLSKCANEVRNGLLDAKDSNAIVAASNAMLSAIRTIDIEDRIAALEKEALNNDSE